MASFWTRIFSSGGTKRQSGLQLASPSYSSSPAVPVTTETALQLSSVWACAKLIAETVGSLPIRIYDINPETGVRTRNVTHPLNRLFEGKVNRWQTRQEFFETLTYQIVLLGNNYSAVQRNSKDEIIALVPLMTEQMELSLEDDGSLKYKYTDGTNVSYYAEKTIWHNKLFGNGVIGLSPLSYARNSVGVGQAVEKSVTDIYKNGGKPSGVLTIDHALKPEQKESVRKSFAQLAQGNESRLFVLEAAMKFQQVSLSPQDIELLASRKFQIEDIARFFGVPSVLINDTQASTTWGSGIQQIVEGWYKLGLRPYLERYESSMKVRLLRPEERNKIDIEFDLDQLLQPSLSERIKTMKDGVTGGIMTPDEARRMEGWTPKDGGDNLFMQQQMTPISRLANPVAQTN